MDKEAFLHQLESSIANNDKNLFAKAIYDLPADVIVGFTKEEFSRIIHISHQFSSQKMDRLCNFLEIKGSFFLKNTLKGVNELNNSLLSKFYYSLYICLSENNKEKLKRVVINNVVVCCMLAKMGVNVKENFETAIHLCGSAQELFPKTSLNYAHALINEGNVRSILAEMGIQSRENLETAVDLYGNSRKILSKTSQDYARALINEGNSRQTLAKMGIQSRENLETAADLYGNSRKTLSKTSQDYARALMNEGNARQILAETGINSKENLETAISLYSYARIIFPETSSGYASSLMNDGNARQTLAEIGIHSRENLETSISFYNNAKEIFPKTSSDYANALMNEGSTRRILAETGINSKENLEIAISLYRDAIRIFPETSEGYGLALMNEGNARVKRAEMGIQRRENLETAVDLYSKSREVILKTSEDYARALANEGNARQILAEIGIQSRENLETAISLYSDTRRIFPETSADYASSLMNEGNARQRLAEIGIHSRENLETAISFYDNAREVFPKTSASYARTLMNEGNARKKLAETGIQSRENFEESKKLYLKSISVFEELRDGWIYSVALLNLNDLLKDNYYKTGDKKYLEEWERNLGNIEEKIKYRDIRYKELLMARIHEIRASLLEFEGKSGIYNASLEYDKAYDISKDPFYKFMNGFCQARIDTKSFCELVSDWKGLEKEGIFLDYFDYMVFECHLETALRNTIDEENELKLAVEKLKEIRDRTQIKIIKDRVSAYIYLLQALVDCFNKDSYKEAAENVKEGCKIFREYGDKQGQQMCEIFHNAVVKKIDLNAWQEIIRNRKFSSNFYSLLCEYSDRKRANLEYYMSGQLHAKVDIISEKVEKVGDISIRTENKIDEIQNEIRSGFAGIKDQIEEGFDGTAAELRQIKGKIDNIEQDLDNLVRLSKEIGGKEGECIKEFSLQMLELMKKGDCEALKRFIERIVQNSSAITEIIEAAEIPEKEKEEAKLKLSDFKKLPAILKEKAKSFSVDVTKDIIVSLTAEQIITLLTPVLSTAAFGVPVPSQIVTMLLAAIRN